MLLDSYNLARRSYSEGERPLHQGHFAGSLFKNSGWRVFLCVKLPDENPRRLRYLPTLLRQRLLRAQVHFADVGPRYLVMELIEGASLKGPLPLKQALNYSAQIVTPLTLFTKGIPQWRSEARNHSGDQSRPNHSHRGCGSPSRPKCEVRDGLARMRQPKSDALMSEVQRGE